MRMHSATRRLQIKNCKASERHSNVKMKRHLKLYPTFGTTQPVN